MAARSLSLKDVAEATRGQLLGEDRLWRRVATDSRKGSLSGALFVALRGARFDGHDFVEAALERGAVAALVSRPLPAPIPQVVVEDTLFGLGQVGRLWRETFFKGTLIAVTGSNGKTTTREMVFHALGGGEAVLKTEGNLNNEIGVPLTLCRLQPHHRFAVIEMGARKRGDIAYLTHLARPQLGIVTCAGPAHLEGFGSLEGVAEAKGELLTHLPKGGVAILNADDPFCPLWEKLAQERALKIVRFGFSERAEVRVIEMEPPVFEDGRFRNRFRVTSPKGGLDVELQLAGQHNIRNALAAIATALSCEIPLERIRKGLLQLAPVPGRLRPLFHLKGGILLDDCYNANPASMEAALEVLGALEGERWVVMGGLAELGGASRAYHAEMGKTLRRRGVERLFALGEETKITVEHFGPGGRHFEHREALIEALLKALHRRVHLLVKGSRCYRLETVIEALTQP